MKSEVHTAHFTVNGATLTNLIRDCFVEGRLTVAKNICEDTGAPEFSWIRICTGTASITGDTAIGDGTLQLGSDEVKTHNGFLLEVNESIKRLEEQYANKQLLFSNAEARIRYYSLRCDWDGIKYRTTTKRVLGEFPYHLNHDKETVKRVGLELAEMEPLFSWLYPTINKKAEDFILTDFIHEDEIFEPDIEHPYYLPNMKDKVNNGKDIESVDGKIIEREAYKTNTPTGELPDAGKAIEEGKQAILDSPRTKEEGILINEGRTKEWQDWACNGGQVEGKDVYITKPIPVDVGDGTIVGCRGKKHLGIRNDNKLHLVISTFAGTSIGAMHHYGHLDGPYISWHEMTGCGGYDSFHTTNVYDEPSWCKKVNIKLTKPTEQWEIDQYPERYHGYKVGDASYAFWDIPSIVKHAQEYFKEHLEPMGWELEIDEEDLKYTE